jgi:predicted metal-dependent hydrolase
MKRSGNKRTKRLRPGVIPKIYGLGTTVLYFGEAYTIVPAQAGSAVDTMRKTICLSVDWQSAEAVKQGVLKLLRAALTAKIHQRVMDYSTMYGVDYGTIRIKNIKSRWGSCSSLGNLNFNLQLSGAPDAIVDYIVVHEICHLIHLNHSEQFWKAVERAIPDWRVRRKWLRQNGHLLNLDYQFQQKK